jgi:hypothetical protein
MHVHNISRPPQSATNSSERSVRYKRRAQARRRNPLSHPHSTPQRVLKNLYKFISVLQDDKESSRRSNRRRSGRRRSSVRAGSISGSFRKDGSLKNSFTSEDYQATLKKSMIQKHMRQASLLSISTNVSTRSILQCFNTEKLLFTFSYMSRGQQIVWRTVLNTTVSLFHTFIIRNSSVERRAKSSTFSVRFPEDVTFFSIASIPALGLSRPSRSLKRPRSEADHSTLTSAEVKNYTSTPPYVFIPQ